MKIGVIARSENRGLGIQTREVVRNLQPDRVLLIEPTTPNWPTHPDWYADEEVTTVGWDFGPALDEDVVRGWLDGLDVIYTAETFYDWRIPRWAALAGAGAVCHANPELLRVDDRRVRHVTWWTATPWLNHTIPDVRVVPMPCPTDRFPQPSPPSEKVRFLHVAGHAALKDRNGTATVAKALRHVNRACSMKMVGQDGRLPSIGGWSQHVDIEYHPRGFENYWSLYDNVDVVVLPRRFGGLCLPAIEALAAGVAVLMPACAPNDIWPGPRMNVEAFQPLHTMGGDVPLATILPDVCGDAMQRLVEHPDHVARYREEALEWATANSWSALAPSWRAELGRAADAACRSSSPPAGRRTSGATVPANG